MAIDCGQIAIAKAADRRMIHEGGLRGMRWEWELVCLWGLVLLIFSGLLLYTLFARIT